MKALLLAATSSLALTGFAMAQTATTTTTDTAVTNPAAAAGDKIEDAADKAESAMDQAGNKVDEAVTTSSSDAAEDVADKAEDAADKAEDKADAATTAGTATVTTTTDTATTAPAASTAVTTTTASADDAKANTAVATTDAKAAPVAAPDVNAPVMSAENPGMLGSYIMNRKIWTTNQPSSTAWSNTTLTERPADWADIAKVDDIVVDPQGNVMGYVADIGGFLGLGAKQVLLGKDALHLVKIGEDAFFATNFTKDELQALPEFDATTVMK